MNQDYVEKRTIFECIVGSQAYGTNNALSDQDYCGVMVPGKEYFYGFQNFEQFQDFEGLDKTIYGIRKALNLIADNNPNMLDLLYAPQRCVVRNSKYWDRVVENKGLFISKRIRYTFSGYAIAQLKRIKIHRKFLLNPLTRKPERADFGLSETPMFPTSQIRAVCQAALEMIIEQERESFISELDKIYGDYVVPLISKFIIPEQRIVAMDWLQQGIKSQVHAFTSLGTQYIKDEYIDQATRELQYYNASSEWKQYQEWKKTRNKKRADLEAKFGYDCKHAMHLVRLMRTGKEALETGVIHVDRTGIDAEELKEIREGSWKFDQVEEYANKMDKELAGIYETTTLQKSPDRDGVSRLCVDIVDQYLEETK